MKFISGNFNRPDGTPASNATLELWLSQDATNLSVGFIEHCMATISLGLSGEIPGSTAIWANDELLPAGTYYRVTLTDGIFGLCFDERLVIQGASPINLNLIPPALRS